MPTVAIQLDPSRLTNPDLDIRYVLPDQLEEDSASAVSDDGYDYGRTSDRLTLFLRTADLAVAVPIVLGTLENEIFEPPRFPWRLFGLSQTTAEV